MRVFLAAMLLPRWRPHRCCCRDRCFQRAIAELGEGSLRQQSEQQRLQQEQAQQAARVMRSVKPPRADCFQVATAYFPAWTSVSAGTDASSENRRAGRRKSSTAFRAPAAATGASAAGSARDEACQTSLGRLPRIANAYFTASTSVAAGAAAPARIAELGEGVLDNNQSNSCSNRRKLSKQRA